MIDTFFSKGGLATSEAGYTLIELLVTSLLAIVVLGGILSALESSQRVQTRDTEWALTLQDGRTGLARMAHEIRQASEIITHEGGTIEFIETIGSTVWKVKYECGVAQSGTSFHECLRKAVESKTGTLPSSGTPVVRDVLNSTAVFKYFKGAIETTEPKEMNVVTLKVELPRKGTLSQAAAGGGYVNNAVLENAAFMRNCDLEESTGKVNGC